MINISVISVITKIKPHTHHKNHSHTMKAVKILQFLLRYAVFLPNCPQLSNTLDQPRKITKNAVEYNLREVAILHKLNLQNSAVLITHCKILIPCLKKYFNIFMAFLFIKCLFPSSYLIMIIIIIITYFNTMSISVII